MITNKAGFIIGTITGIIYTIYFYGINFDYFFIDFIPSLLGFLMLSGIITLIISLLSAIGRIA